MSTINEPSLERIKELKEKYDLSEDENQKYLLKNEMDTLISETFKTTLKEISELKNNILELEVFINQVIDHFSEFNPR
ncbi:MAG: hypothetical protein WCX88_04305 [Patescibacteria group bacterium]